MANIEQIKKQAFKDHPEADEIFITTDGHLFLNSNASNLHKNTNKSKKKIKVVSFKRETANDYDSEESTKPFSKMKTAELEAFAEEKGIDISEATNNAQRAEKIQEAMNSKIEE